MILENKVLQRTKSVVEHEHGHMQHLETPNYKLAC